MQNKKNSKNGHLSGLMMLSIVLTASPAFAESDVHDRNIFNHVTDWGATIGKNAEEKQRIIDERVEMRAEKRKIHGKEEARENAIDQTYSSKVDDLKKSNNLDKIMNDRDAALSAFNIKANEAHKNLNDAKGEAKQKAELRSDEETRNYEKQVADLREQYMAKPDEMTAKLNEAENNHKVKMDKLNDQWKAEEADLNAKAQELDVRLDKEKADIANTYDMKKQMAK